MSLRSTQNARYTDQIPTIDAEIVGGNSIHESFRVAGGYPADFLDTLAVGEQSGKSSSRWESSPSSIKTGRGWRWRRWPILAGVGRDRGVIIVLIIACCFYRDTIMDLAKPRQIADDHAKTDRSSVLPENASFRSASASGRIR